MYVASTWAIISSSRLTSAVLILTQGFDLKVLNPRLDDDGLDDDTMIPVTDGFAGELKTIDTSTKVCYENLFQSCANQGRDFQTCNAKLLDPQLFSWVVAGL